jgi:hypothetical protein
MSPLTNPQSADHIAATAGTFEPQRQNNFSVEFAIGASDKDIIVMSHQGFPLPKESNEEVTIPYQNETRYVAGKYAVDAGTLVLTDYVDVDTRGAIMRWRKMVYDPATGIVGLAKDYKKTGYIVMTAPDGTRTRVCKLKGSWPQAVDGGELTMDASDKVTMSVTIRYDKVSWSESLPGA